MTATDEANSKQIQDRLIDFLETKLGFIEDKSHLQADEPLLGGVLDSLDMIRLVRFIRDEFGVRVRDEDLVPDNFETISSITHYVRTAQEGM